MKKGFLYSPAGIVWVASLVVGLLTWIVLLQTAHPTPDASEPWYAWFVTPGLLGTMVLAGLTGGAHSRVPEWLGIVAFYVANGLFWVPLACVAIRVACHSRIARARSVSDGRPAE